jgi:hypothetical protein
VIVPATEGGEVDPAVQRLLRRYDPDYVATLLFSLGDFEAMNPGRSPLNVDGNEVLADERAAFIERAEANGPRLMGSVVGDDVLNEIAASLPCFKDGDGRARLHWVHPAQEPPRPLAKVEIPPEHQVRLETGDALVDLASGMQNGFPDAPTETRRLFDKSLTRGEVGAILTKDRTYEARIVALASMRRDVSNRQSRHQSQTVDRAQGGGHRAAISAHVVRFDVQRLPAGHIPSVHPPRQISEKATSQLRITLDRKI